MAATDAQPLDPAQAVRSPSPTPLPPISSAPGPRATALTTLYNDAIAHLMKTCSHANFSACFPTPARIVPRSVKQLHEQFTEKLGDQLRVNFEDLLRERDAVASLNGLDRLVEEARARKQKAEVGGEGAVKGVPPYALPPQALYLSHLAPQIRQWLQETKEQQSAVQAENAELLARIQQQRKDIAALVAGVENVVADLDASVAALSGENLDELREEARDADEGMRMEM